MTSFAFAKLDAEAFIAKRLGEHGVRVFEGTTHSAERQERIRQAIVANGLAMTVVGKRKDGTVETYQAIFQRLYGVPLVTGKRKPIAKQGALV